MDKREINIRKWIQNNYSLLSIVATLCVLSGLYINTHSHSKYSFVLVLIGGIVSLVNTLVHRFKLLLFSVVLHIIWIAVVIRLML